MKFVTDYLPMEMSSVVQEISFTYHELVQKYTITMPDEMLYGIPVSHLDNYFGQNTVQVPLAHSIVLSHDNKTYKMIIKLTTM